MPFETAGVTNLAAAADPPSPQTHVPLHSEVGKYAYLIGTQD